MESSLYGDIAAYKFTRTMQVLCRNNPLSPKNDYIGGSANGHSGKRTALHTAAFTKSCFSPFPYKLSIFTFP